MNKKWLYGLLQAAEGGIIGALGNIAIDPNTFSAAGLKRMGIMVAIGAAIAVRNYLKEAPRVEWTPAERALKAGS